MTRFVGMTIVASFLLCTGQTAFAADLSMPSADAADPKIFWRTVMTGLYGPYDARQKCWIGKVGAEAYCMRPHKLQTVEVKGRKQHHIAMGGRKVGGQDCHACAGAMGLAVLEDDGTTVKLAAANSLAEEFGSWGKVPPEESFVLVETGADNHGWLIESGYTAQGITMAGSSVYGRKAGEIVNLGDIRTSYDDCGYKPDACRSIDFDLTFTPAAGRQHYDIEARLAPDSGKVEAGDRFDIPFDETAGRYVQPEAMSGALE